MSVSMQEIIDDFLLLFKEMQQYNNSFIVCFSFKDILFGLENKIKQTNFANQETVKQHIKESIESYKEKYLNRQQSVDVCYCVFCQILKNKELIAKEMVYFIIVYVSVICELIRWCL